MAVSPGDIVVPDGGCGDDHPERMWAPGKGWSQDVYLPRILDYPRAEIPFDFHELVATIAPRALFVNAPLRDKWFPNWGSVARIMAAAAPVFRLHDVPHLIRVEHPWPFRLAGAHRYPLRRARNPCSIASLRSKACEGFRRGHRSVENPDPENGT